MSAAGERPADPSGAEAAGDEPRLNLRLRRQIGDLFKAFRGSPVAPKLAVLIAAIVVVVGATAFGQIELNRWNKPFFDALSRRDFGDFLVQLGWFFVIVGGLLVLNVAQRWFVELLKLRLREALVGDLVAHWLAPRRAFWLAHSGSMGVNPDQRMHEDARKLCELSADLGVGLLQATILFVSFAGILWGLSEDFSFRFGDADYAFPGFMLWAAILYAGLGSLLSYRVGRSLIDRNADRYAREADLRFTMVRVNEHLDGISLARGEADERRRVEHALADVLVATRRLARGLTNLTWVTAGFGWVTNVAPILVAVPLYFTGKISFGGLMMAAAAFTQAQSSLRWFIDNFSIIADWRATLLRVSSFRQVLVLGDAGTRGRRRIDYAGSEGGVLELEALEVETQAGRERLAEAAVRIGAGERVLVAAAAGTSKTQLFRALAGLWPWGSGCIRSPESEPVAYLPRGTPYLPSGTLREILAYPGATDRHVASDYERVLSRLGLERYVSQLDAQQRWDRELSQDEQLRLSFARLLLQQPRWVFIDDVFGALDEDALERVLSLFERELAAAAVVHIGTAVQGHEAWFSRNLHLVKLAGERT